MSTKEAMDMVGSSISSGRRRGSAPKAGSVWESRMKLDQVKGGFRVFNATPENPDQDPTQITTTSTTTTVSSPEIQMDKKADNARPKQSPISGVSGKRKTWKSENSDGSPVQIARKRSDLSKNSDEQSKELSVSGDGTGIKRSPVSIKKTRSVSSSDGNEKSEAQLRKVKSEPTDGDLKAKTGVARKLVVENIKNSVVDEPNKVLGGSTGGIGETLITGAEKSRSDEEFGLCEDKSITGNVGRVKIPPSDDDEDDFADRAEEEEDSEIEVEKRSLDIKEITVPKKIVIEEKKQHIAPVNHARVHPTPTKTKPTSDNFHGIPRTNSKLQSFVDLVMWRDASKSAFVFGIGTFAIISSSYTKDLSISFITVISYLGLVYLAAIFIFRSLINRGSSTEMDDANKDCVVGEEEAIWVVKLLLPYLNEFLLKLRALFSGDPATTMKLAVLLFILARCGSSITVWKMAKLGFIGVFTVPKVCSTYSSQLTAYGTFWIRRFGDVWESCSHKKAVGFAIFTLVWNLSSIVARIWAVFVLFVAFKYYQQSLTTREEWAHDEQSNGGRRSTPKQKKVY